MKKLVFDQDSNGEEFEVLDLNDQDEEFVSPWRERMCEILSEVDDEFMERYLEDDIDPEYIDKVIRKATLELKLVPVFSGSALKNVGVQPLMDGVGKYLPSPLEAPKVTGINPQTGAGQEVEPSANGPFQALAFKVVMDSGRKMVLMRIYSGKIEAGDTVRNFTQGKDERVARLFKIHAGRKERLDVAGIGDIVGAAGLKDTRTGDTLSTSETPLVLEQIEMYKPVISMAIEPRNVDESEKLEEVLDKYLQEDPTLA